MNLNFNSTQLMNENFSDGDYSGYNNGGMNHNNNSHGGMNDIRNQIEDRIFELEKIDYNKDGITSIIVCNGKMAMTTRNNYIIRLDLADSIPYEIKMNSDIYKIFCDPTGNHMVICMTNEEIYYLHSQSTTRKPKQLKIKVDLIESIAWDPAGDKNNVQTILIGSNKGRVYETVVSGVEKGFYEYLGGNAPILKMLHTFDDFEPVMGMNLERVQNKNFLMVSTPTRLYHLIAQVGSYEQLFDRYHISFEIVPEEGIPNEACGQLKFFSKSHISLPQSYGWLVSTGIRYGDLIYGAQNPGDKFATPPSMLFFKPDNQENFNNVNTITSGGGVGGNSNNNSNNNTPKGGNSGSNTPNPYQQLQSFQPALPPTPPVSFALSQFHFLLVYEDRFIALSKLNYQIVYEQDFRGKGTRLHSIAIDNTERTIWLCGDNALYELRITDEDRDAWRLYMEKGQFDMALAYAKEPYLPEKRDKIWQTQAEHYFKEERYELSATFFGKTHKVFEEITLKFINVGQRDALKTYLLQKLTNLNRGQETQKTIICTWLIEIFISKLNTLRDPSNKDKYNKVNSEFRQFLENFKDTLIVIKDITFNIISSHGAIEELLFYANLIEDYERVISYHIQHQQYEKALSILTTLDKPKPPPSQQQQQQQQPQKNNRLGVTNVQQPEPDELYYKFCPILFHFIPYQTCEAWIQTKTGFLDPKKLIPSLMRYDHSKTPPGQPNQAIRYLQYCVNKQGNTDRPVHNYLLSLYVKQEEDGPLSDFLNDGVHFDLKYALRLCMREKKLKACVYIYSAMELYEEAVDLALLVDIDLAKENADKVRDTDEELCKKLWLRIAEHQVKKDGNIKEAMEFLKACSLLKIEDILPFFPNFTVIDDFKEEICKSLEDYNSYIDELKAAMDDATKSAQQIRKDIQNLRNKYGHVRGDQKCDICNYPVLTKRFYLFSCRHVFHSDCLITQLMKHLSPMQKQRIRELEMSIGHNHIDLIAQGGQNNQNPVISNISSILGNISGGSGNQSQGDENENVSQEDLDRNELDRMVGKECLYCGDIMIRSIEQPFIGLDEIETLESWEI
ncbi:hypothetical protein ACTA71_010558 [Dictyostelium dimigraforme]